MAADCLMAAGRLMAANEPIFVVSEKSLPLTRSPWGSQYAHLLVRYVWLMSKRKALMRPRVKRRDLQVKAVQFVE